MMEDSEILQIHSKLFSPQMATNRLLDLSTTTSSGERMWRLDSMLVMGVVTTPH